MKRILTIQDISALGKCSATVALPIISAMGVECAVMPTAVLSTHTMFSGFTFHDLTDEMAPITQHWKNEGITYDAVYTGYLGSERQIELVGEIFDSFPDAKIVVDPAMADNGRMYPAFTPAFAKQMAKLCARADLILPNLTEACFMLDKEYIEEGYDQKYIKDILIALTELGAKTAMLTGVSFEKGKLGAMSYNKEGGEFYYYANTHLPVRFHGTGDIFSSTVVGAMMGGRSVNEAMEIAVDYTLECIRLTMEDKNANWYGVNFEQAMPYLIRRTEL